MKKNAVAHFEIYGEDPNGLARFYTSLFDWTIEQVPGMDYRMVKTVETDATGAPNTPGGINGGLVKSPTPDTRGWLNYVSVESLDVSLQRAQQLGAKVTRGRTAVPGMGWYAMLSDPQGNPFAIWQDDPQAR